METYASGHMKMKKVERLMETYASGHMKMKRLRG